MFGTDYELEYANDYPVLHNDEKLTIDTAKVLEEYRDAIKELTNIQECDPLPASEDFVICLGKASCFYVCRGFSS